MLENGEVFLALQQNFPAPKAKRSSMENPKKIKENPHLPKSSFTKNKRQTFPPVPIKEKSTMKKIHPINLIFHKAIFLIKEKLSFLKNPDKKNSSKVFLEAHREKLKFNQLKRIFTQKKNFFFFPRKFKENFIF
jgi:hypothetical protein